MTKLTSQLEIRLQDKVSGAAKKAAQSLSGVTRAMKETNAAPVPLGTRLDASLHRVNSAMAGARMGMFDAMAGVYALNRTFGASVRSAGNFEESMKMVGVLSGASAEEVAKLSEQAKELGRTTEFTSNQAAQAQRFLAMAGFDSNEIYGALPSTLQLASAASMDLASAADVASNVLTGYNLTTDQLGHANDVMVTAFTSANTNLQDLGVALKYAGPVASAAGVSFEEAAAAIALMGNAGIQGSMAGTAMRGAVKRMLGPTPKMAKAMKEAGLKFTDASGRLLPMVDIIKQLEPHADNVGLMMELFGQRAGPGMMALVSQGSEALDKLTSDMENSGGAAQNVADVKMSGFNGQMRKLKSAADGLGMAIGEALIPGLQELAEKLTAALGPITEFAAAHPDLIEKVGMAAGALVSLKLATAASKFAFFGLGSGVLTTTRALVGLPDNFKAVTRSVLAMSGALLTNPLVWIAAGIAAAGYLIYQNWDRVSAFFQGFWEAIKPYVEPAAERIKAAFEPLGPVIEAVGNAISGVVDFFERLLNPAKATAEELANAQEAGRQFGEAFGPSMETGLNLVAGLIETVVTSIETTIKVIDRLINLDPVGAWQEWKAGASEIFSNLLGGNDPATVMENTWERIKTAGGSFKSWYENGGIGKLFSGDIFSSWTKGNEEAAKALEAHNVQLSQFSSNAADAVAKLKEMGQVERNKVEFEAANALKDAQTAYNKTLRTMTGTAWGGVLRDNKEALAALDALKSGTGSIEELQAVLKEMQGGDDTWLANNAKKLYEQSITLGDLAGQLDGYQSALDNVAKANEAAAATADQATKAAEGLAKANDAVQQTTAPAAAIAEGSKPTQAAVVPSMKPSEVQALESKIAKVRAAAAELPGVVKGALQQATQVMESQDWTIHGEKLMETLVAGVRNKTRLLKQEVEKALAETRKLLPSSDAKEGPLSRLTANGAAIIETMAKGVRQGGSGPLKGALAAQLSGVSGPVLIGASRSSGASPAAGSARTPVNVTVSAPVTINGSSADASQIGQEVARHIREQVQEAFRGLHADTGMRFA